MGSFRNPRSRAFATKPRLPLKAKGLCAFSLGSFGFVFAADRFARPREVPHTHVRRRRSLAAQLPAGPSSAAETLGRNGILWDILGHFGFPACGESAEPPPIIHL